MARTKSKASEAKTRPTFDESLIRPRGETHFTQRCPSCMRIVTMAELERHKRLGCANLTVPNVGARDGDNGS